MDFLWNGYGLKILENMDCGMNMDLVLNPSGPTVHYSRPSAYRGTSVQDRSAPIRRSTRGLYLNLMHTRQYTIDSRISGVGPYRGTFAYRGASILDEGARRSLLYIQYFAYMKYRG